ncbi:MAG: hypothetical protein PHU06_10785 [Gallionella sp.]|nr:hypothetical protein [Gallionella sp.]MDD4960168.1 hypothetical protein [Gallionella sp.]
MKSIQFCTLFLAFFLTGCTTAAWYDGFKQQAENECQRQPADARERCLARVNKQSYEDYQRERVAK